MDSIWAGTLRLIATAATNGTHHDLPPRNPPATPPEIVVHARTEDAGALQQGPWLLWRRAGALTPPEARIALHAACWQRKGSWRTGLRTSGGWWSTGPGPADAGSKPLTWLTLEDSEHGVWELVTAEATAPFPDLSLPAEAWTPVRATRLEGQYHGRPFHAMAPEDTRGGTALETLATQEAAGGIRVDLGNHVDNPNDDWRRPGLDDTLKRMAMHPLAALVPYKFELRLNETDARRLAAATPLVSANLLGPPGVLVHPWRLVRHEGQLVGLVGASDTRYLERYGLVDGTARWRSRPTVDAVREAALGARAAGARTLVLLTSLDDDQVEEVDREVPGFAVIIRALPDQPADPLARLATRPAGGSLPTRAWLHAGSDRDQLLTVDMHFGSDGDLAAVGSRVQEVLRSMAPPDATMAWRAWELRSAFIEPRRNLLLPARSTVLAGTAGAYTPAEWGQLLAGTVRAATGAEVTLVPSRRRGLEVLGEVPEYVAEDWVPANLRLVRGQITGKQLRALLQRRHLTGIWAWAGVDAMGTVVGGRPLQEDETYSLVTTDAFAWGEGFRGIFKGDFLPITARDLDGDGHTELQDVVLARWRAASAQGWGGPRHLAMLRDWLSDDGRRSEPQWRLTLQPVELNGQQLTAQNREAFAGARNALVTAPEAQALRARLKGQARFEDHRLVWDTNTSILWDQSTIAGAGQNTVRRDSNEGRVGSEVRGRPAGPAGGLVPFINGGYATDLVPGTNVTTGLANPRRQDVTAGLGLVWTGPGPLREARLGATTRRDFSVADRTLEPGYQAGLAAQWAVAAGRVTLDVDARGFGPTPQDTAADLGLICQIGLAYRQPVAEGLELRIGVDGLLFQGKVEATRTLGSTLVPSVGLSWQAHWKPGAGVAW